MLKLAGLQERHRALQWYDYVGLEKQPRTSSCMSFIVEPRSLSFIPQQGFGAEEQYSQDSPSGES